MDALGPIYLGFDLSTQQLKALAVTAELHVVCESKFDFDADSVGFTIKNGVITNEEEHEVYAPVALWLQALDTVLQSLKDKGLDFGRVKGISGAGQQHGSVYWSDAAERLLRCLDGSRPLAEQLDQAFSYPFSPNWQDASTQAECETFNHHLGSEDDLALNTGSKAHHRFTGPQILRFRRSHPVEYQSTSRISLVSSFLASVFLGRIAPFDISDVCGMNLWDIKAGTWNEKLVALAAGSSGLTELKRKLGPVSEDGSGLLGNVASYFIRRYHFSPSCVVAPFTGDNPATILALPLRSMDAMVSLGTSTTFLMSTSHYKPEPAVHFFNHPTTPGLYMFMLCYKNGGLARERIRDAVNQNSSAKSWANFDRMCSSSPPLGQCRSTDAMKIGLYFPRPEIVPNVRAGEWHFNYDPSSGSLTQTEVGWVRPNDDARAIVESQLLSLRLRSRDLFESPGEGLPPQPRRIYLVGGGSQNIAIAKVVGEVLGGTDGVYKLDAGGNACALGAAYKAVWAVEREEGQTFEELIGSRWDQDRFVRRIADGYQKGIFEQYGVAVEAFAKMEEEVLRQEDQ
ncbi:MAG: D-xylulose kinase [Lasallia pustulata]|uniref:Xylulose kinase n=1 Tax=Lasallia pustulata TaxID=136370 RepID=A0A5M8Q066_9LECA|nr:MAG: D-xylulose kinase [Lasallia pustulata]